MLNNAPTLYYTQRHDSCLLKFEINRFLTLYKCHYFEISIYLSVIVLTKNAHLIVEIPDPANNLGLLQGNLQIANPSKE